MRNSKRHRHQQRRVLTRVFYSVDDHFRGRAAVHDCGAGLPDDVRSGHTVHLLERATDFGFAAYTPWTAEIEACQLPA